MLVDDLIIRHSIEIATAIIAVVLATGKAVQAFKDHKAVVSRQIDEQKIELDRIADKIDKNQMEIHKQLNTLIKTTVKNDTEIKHLLETMNQLFSAVTKK